ncbi:hypothetical protein J6590_072231 [Homalodisca vitripennis]|nr:hypothetical protein J6590_072231 [Homalodisca vitripennis]
MAAHKLGCPTTNPLLMLNLVYRQPLYTDGRIRLPPNGDKPINIESLLNIKPNNYYSKGAPHFNSVRISEGPIHNRSPWPCSPPSPKKRMALDIVEEICNCLLHSGRASDGGRGWWPKHLALTLSLSLALLHSHWLTSSCNSFASTIIFGHRNSKRECRSVRTLILYTSDVATAGLPTVGAETLQFKCNNCSPLDSPDYRELIAA